MILELQRCLFRDFKRINNFQKVDIFVVYLGTDASFGKMDVIFVISDPETAGDEFFRKSKIFEKRCLHIRVVPSNSLTFYLGKVVETH